MSKFVTLPIELIYRILDQQSDGTLFLSMQNVCRRFNQILRTYHRYQVKDLRTTKLMPYKSIFREKSRTYETLIVDGTLEI